MARKTLQVRIIAGSFKGRVLKYPASRLIRPTMQRVKSSVFESIGREIVAASFMDLYCGAGAMGIEALSRGARVAHFVESNPVALRHLRENLRTMDLESDRACVHRGRTIEFLERGGLERTRPDVIYADPPYGGREAELLLEVFSGLGYSYPHLIVVEHEQALTPEVSGVLHVVKEKSFGQSRVSFIRIAQGDDE